MAELFCQNKHGFHEGVNRPRKSQQARLRGGEGDVNGKAHELQWQHH